MNTMISLWNLSSIFLIWTFFRFPLHQLDKSSPFHKKWPCVSRDEQIAMINCWKCCLYTQGILHYCHLLSLIHVLHFYFTSFSLFCVFYGIIWLFWLSPGRKTHFTRKKIKLSCSWNDFGQPQKVTKPLIITVIPTWLYVSIPSTAKNNRVISMFCVPCNCSLHSFNVRFQLRLCFN